MPSLAPPLPPSIANAPSIGGAMGESAFAAPAHAAGAGALRVVMKWEATSGGDSTVYAAKVVPEPISTTTAALAYLRAQEPLRQLVDDAAMALSHLLSGARLLVDLDIDEFDAHPVVTVIAYGVGLDEGFDAMNRFDEEFWIDNMDRAEGGHVVVDFRAMGA